MKTLPPVLNSYFDAADKQNIDDFVACFTLDAKVQDEGNAHQGHEEIAKWNRDSMQKYSCTHIVKNSTATKDGMDVTAQVSGTFPGSPIDLTFRFTLENHKISALKIG